MTTYNTFSQRFSNQRQKRAAFINQKQAEKDWDKSQEMNLVNSLIEGGIAWFASGGNPLAAGAAALTSKRGKTDIIGSGIGGVSKGMTVGNLSNIGAGEAAKAGATEAAKSKGSEYGLNIIQAATDAAKGSVKNPGRVVNALQAFNPNTQIQAIQGLQAADEKNEAKRILSEKLQADKANEKARLQADTTKQRNLLDKKIMENKLSKKDLELVTYKAEDEKNKQKSQELIDRAIKKFPLLIKSIEMDPANAEIKSEKITEWSDMMISTGIDKFLDKLKGLSTTERAAAKKKMLKSLSEYVTKNFTE